MQNGSPNDELRSMELTIKLQYEMNALLYYALPLCIFLADDKLLPWYYENFIEIFSHNYVYRDEKYQINKEYFTLYYLCDINTNRYNCNFFANLADEIPLGYDLLKREPDITPFIIENIQKGYYTIVYLDEYYLPDKENYMREHHVHESLLYGYDDRFQKFKSIGFDVNHAFGMMELDYHSVSTAFDEGKVYYKQHSGEWAETMAVRLIKPFQFETEYPFSIQRYLAKLDKYRLSVTEPDRIYSFRLHNADNCRFGINMYDAVLYHFKQMLKGRVSIGFKELHLLFEHKRYIYNSLNYIQNRFQWGGDLGQLIEKYLEIVSAMNDIRRIFLKNTYKRRTDLKLVAGMIEKTERLKEAEQQIMTDIIDRLKVLIGEQ